VSSTKVPVRSAQRAINLSRVQTARPAPESVNVLYAEDDGLVRKLTVRLLAGAGYKVTSVEDGLAAWEALQKAEFNLLITDNDMPNLTGIELITRLRRNNVTLPIILASGSAGFFSGEEYRCLNLSACIQKPFLPNALVAAVGKVLGPARA
jgi:CheY-like chemotaxis protein